MAYLPEQTFSTEDVAQSSIGYPNGCKEVHENISCDGYKIEKLQISGPTAAQENQRPCNEKTKVYIVNGDLYRAMITNFFIPELNKHDAQELWFQQDGATCHTASATIDLLKDMFGDRLISRFGPVNWPPRSCDLTPLDYFL
ncbi:putative transposable element [Trichonephila clavipes]|nr:putative transposable element [Trichonephila clavipes]